MSEEPKSGEVHVDLTDSPHPIVAVERAFWAAATAFGFEPTEKDIQWLNGLTGEMGPGGLTSLTEALAEVEKYIRARVA